MKKIAVILATYNGEKYITEQLESLKNQHCSDVTVYIHDDGSTDKTLDIIDEYVKLDNDSVKFILWSKQSLGYPQCFINTLLSIPRADYYAFCDQDDVWNEDKLDKAISVLEAEKRLDIPVLFYSAVDYYDGNLKYMRSARFNNNKKKIVDEYCLNELLLGGEAMGMTFVFNNVLRDVMSQVVEKRGIDFKDTFMKIYAAACGKVFYSREACAKYRRHLDATTIGMNPANNFSRFFNMTKKIFIDKDGMASVQDSVNFIYDHFFENIKEDNAHLLFIFTTPNTFSKRIQKVLYLKRFRLKILDELGYRVAFILGRI